MKRLIIINDLHGNYEALKAILQDIQSHQYHYDYFLSTGDLIGIGPSHNEVIEELLKIPNFYAVKGNHECYLLHGFHNPTASLEAKHHLWIKEQINQKALEFIKTLPLQLIFQIEKKKVALLHYPILQEQPMIRFYPIQNDLNFDTLYSMFNSIDADIYLYGHNHSPSILENQKLLINIGSSGCSNINPGFTRYGILDINQDQVKLDIKLVPYEIKKEREKINQYQVPDKDKILKAFLISNKND